MVEKNSKHPFGYFLDVPNNSVHARCSDSIFSCKVSSSSRGNTRNFTVISVVAYRLQSKIRTELSRSESSSICLAGKYKTLNTLVREQDKNNGLSCLLFVAMLNSAASMLVRQDTATSPEGRTDIADYESKQNGDVNNVTSRLASLNLTSGNNPAVKRPSVVLTDPSAKEAKGKPEEESVKMSTTRERPKRQLPVSPKSLYSTSQPANAQPQSNQESKLTSQQASATPSNRLSTLSTSSSRSSSDNSLTDKPSNRQGLHNQTHIAVFKFVARHSDEIDLDAGDPISVSKMHEDLWYEGVNVRTGKTGIFPSRYVSDILHGSISKESLNSQHNQFFLRFLGSVEVGDFKGNEIICGAMKKIVKQHQLTSVSRPPQCTLEVSARGINIIEHLSQSAAQQSKRQSKRKIGKLFDKERPKHRDGANTSHFFTLKNVTFCGCHPTNARFFAFITKHPEEHRFACHVFMSEFSTEPVAFAVGQAFREFYAEFMDFQAPVEDFYIE